MIIHRAFVREVLRTCAAVSVILLSIFLVARLMGFLRQTLAGDLPAHSVGLLLLLKTITYLDILAPLVLYISTLLVMGRWSRDHELTALNACGFGLAQFVRPAVVLFAVVGGFAALFSLYLSPLSVQASRAIVHELRERGGVAGVRPGVFGDLSGRDGVYFVESYDRDRGEFGNLFIYHRPTEKNAEQSIVVAETGHIHTDETSGAEFLLLQNGSRYRGEAGATEYAVLDFQTYALRIASRPSQARNLPLKAIPTLRLTATGGSDAIGELHWRLAKVFMLPILLLFALVFSSATNRTNRLPGMLPALLIYFAYSNLLGFGVALIRRGAGHPHLTLWAVHLLFLALAIFLLHRRNTNQPLLPGALLRTA